MMLRLWTTGLLATLWGCGPSQPSARYVATVEASQLRVTLRSDSPISSEERALADAVRAAEKAMREWYGDSPATRVDLWALAPQHQSQYLGGALGLGNTGAATRVRRGHSDIYAATPDAAETPEGTALRLRLRQFQVAHEVVHAWLGFSARGAIDEGFANFIAARALEDIEQRELSDGPSGGPLPTLCGPHDAMLFVPRLLAAPLGKFPTVRQAASSTGEEAYVTGWLLFEFAASVLPQDGFRAFAHDLVTWGPAHTSAFFPASNGRAGGALAAADADFTAFSAARAKAAQHWLAPAALKSLGYRADGTAIALGDESVLMVHLSTGAPRTGAVADALRAIGGPAIPRCKSVRFRRVGGEMPWSALSPAGLLLGKAADSSSRALVRGIDAQVTKNGTTPAGEWLTLTFDGEGLVLQDSAGGLLSRLAGSDDVLFRLVLSLQAGPDGLAAFELQADLAEDDPANM